MAWIGPYYFKCLEMTIVVIWRYINKNELNWIEPSLGLQRTVWKRENIQWKCLVDVRGQRRMGRLVPDDRKATGTQISTRSNPGMQNTISERTARGTLKKMGCSSRRPQQVPLLSANSRKLRLRFTQGHQNWTTEDQKKVAWSDESPFQLRHSDGGVRIWRFGVNNMKAWIHPASYQRFRLLVVV